MFDLLISKSDFKKREGNVETYEMVKTGMLKLLWLEQRRKSRNERSDSISEAAVLDLTLGTRVFLHTGFWIGYGFLFYFT